MAKIASWVLGTVLIIAGIWGFFSDAPILGFLAVSTASNVVHIIAGLILVLMAGKESVGAALKAIGIVYVILGLLGLLEATFMANDTAATGWFYLVVGVIMAAVGFMSKRAAASVPPVSPQI